MSKGVSKEKETCRVDVEVSVGRPHLRLPLPHRMSALHAAALYGHVEAADVLLRLMGAAEAAAMVSNGVAHVDAEEEEEPKGFVLLDGEETSTVPAPPVLAQFLGAIGVLPGVLPVASANSAQDSETVSAFFSEDEPLRVSMGDVPMVDHRTPLFLAALCPPLGPPCGSTRSVLSAFYRPTFPIPMLRRTLPQHPTPLLARLPSRRPPPLSAYFCGLATLIRWAAPLPTPLHSSQAMVFCRCMWPSAQATLG